MNGIYHDNNNCLHVMIGRMIDLACIENRKAIYNFDRSISYFLSEEAEHIYYIFIMYYVIFSKY